MIVADWVCIWWVVVRVAALDGRWREERKEHAASVAIFRSLFLLAGWMRLNLAVILVYGWPLDLH